MTDITRAEVSAAEASTTSAAAAAAGQQARLSVHVSTEAVEFLDRIKSERNITYTEAVRRALAIYKLIEDETRQGHQVEIREDNDTVRRLVLI